MCGFVGAGIGTLKTLGLQTNSVDFACSISSLKVGCQADQPIASGGDTMPLLTAGIAGNASESVAAILAAAFSVDAVADRIG